MPDISALVFSIGTGGTLYGTSKYVRERKPDTRIIGVTGATGTRLPGTYSFIDGEYVTPFVEEMRASGIVDHTAVISEEQALCRAKELAEHGFYVGIQTGGVLQGLIDGIKELKIKGDVLMILDADLTVPPEDLPKFLEVITDGKAELANGSRLVYPMEKQAMRFLNFLGNKFFSGAFTFIMEQRVSDTLCGTKVLRRRSYDRIAANRAYFGDFDPFGDFDLLFGAAKLNLKIIDVPIRYRERTYGTTQISRFSHGWLLLRMTAFGLKTLKFA